MVDPAGGGRGIGDQLGKAWAWLRRRPWPFWVLVAFVGYAVLRDPPKDVAPTSAPTAPPAQAAADKASSALDAKTVAGCQDTLAKLGKLGLVRGRDGPDRIEVDERLWAELPYKDKQTLMATASCAGHGSWLPPKGKFVFAYGWRDGERKALISEVGMH